MWGHRERDPKSRESSPAWASRTLRAMRRDGMKLICPHQKESKEPLDCRDCADYINCKIREGGKKKPKKSKQKPKPRLGWKMSISIPDDKKLTPAQMLSGLDLRTKTCKEIAHELGFSLTDELAQSAAKATRLYLSGLYLFDNRPRHAEKRAALEIGLKRATEFAEWLHELDDASRSLLRMDWDYLDDAECRAIIISGRIKKALEDL